jgi:Rod binding domain-containing protein
MYRLSNTMIKNLRTTCSALIVGCSQLIPSIQTPVFAAMLDQQVQDQMTRLNDTYE